MSGYDINFSITVLCPSCGEALPSHSYLTESKTTGVPFDRDNPYERKDRRVFITPCAKCFKPVQDVAPLVEALRKISEAGHRYASTAHIGLIADDALTTIDAQERGV